MTAFVAVAIDVRLQRARRPSSMASVFAPFEVAGISVHGVCAIGEDGTDADPFPVDNVDAAVAAAANAGVVEVQRRDGAGGRGGWLNLSSTEVLQRIAVAGAATDLFYLASDQALVLGAIPLPDARAALEAMERGRARAG